MTGCGRGKEGWKKREKGREEAKEGVGEGECRSAIRNSK